jgi:hypothetical protein
VRQKEKLMKRPALLMAAVAALVLHAAPGAHAADGTTFLSTGNAGDNLFGFHVWGTDAGPRGYSIDGTDTTVPTWSFGYDPSTTTNNNDFFLFSHTYNPGGTGTNATTGINNGYFFRLRGDNGQLDIGNDGSGNLNHPGSGNQVKIWAGTSTQPRDGLGITCYGNSNSLYLDQLSAGLLRTKVNFLNMFQVGTDSTLSGTPDWYLKDSYQGKSTFPLIVGQDDKVVMSYGATVNGLASLAGGATIGGNLQHTGSQLGFYGAVPVTKPVVSGCTCDGSALKSLIQALASEGLVLDNTTQ